MVERLSNGKRLHRRAGLELVGEHAVAHALEKHRGTIVRIVRGLVGQRDDLARVDVRHHDGARLSLMSLDGGPERLVGDELDSGVDRKGHVGARLAFLGPDVVDDAAVTVADHAPRARAPCQHMVAGKFDAFLSVIVRTRVSHDVSHGGTVGIAAAHFGRHTDAGDPECTDGLGQAEIAVAGQIDEVGRRAVVKLLEQLRVLDAEQLRKLAQLLLLLLRAAGHERRVRPDATAGLARREHDAVAVEDLASGPLDRDRARKALFALVLQEVIVEDLQIKGSARKNEEKHQDSEKRKVGAVLRNGNDDEGVGGMLGRSLSGLTVLCEEVRDLLPDGEHGTLDPFEKRQLHGRPPLEPSEAPALPSAAAA